ncbi:helix-turn-helix domain-containing protein, partial [Corynebacterium felinum]
MRCRLCAIRRGEGRETLCSTVAFSLRRSYDCAVGNTFPQREARNWEFQETVSDTFLKTVSAFANHEGGRIFFGVADSGKIVGFNHPNPDFSWGGFGGGGLGWCVCGVGW